MNKVIGYSKIGPSHIKNNLPNQDSYLCFSSKDYSLIVVSDGLGSKPFSDVGSKAACKAVLKASKEFVKNKTKTSVKHFFEMISSFWEEALNGRKKEDCSATCLFTLATKNKLFVARLGDGMICVLGKKQENDRLYCDSKNEGFSNETYSLSNSNLLGLWEYDSLSKADYTGILISTDGISTDLQSGSELMFSRDLIQSLKGRFFFTKKRILSKVMRDWPVPMHSDDKTIAIMEVS